MKRRNLLTVITAIMFLTGCAGQEAATDVQTEKEAQAAESDTVEAETLFHADRYTAEQKDYLRSLWGEEEWGKGGYNDSTAELSLLGSGYEVGHKTTGIARGFSYETENADIPESSGNKKVSYKTIAAWARMEQNFRMEETVPYQYTLQADMTAPKFHIIFPMEEGDDYTFDIIGHTEEGRVCIEWMMVYFHEGSQSRTYSVYESLNYIHGILEQKKDPQRMALDVMAGSVDGDGAYICLPVISGASEYTMAEEGRLDGITPVRIMRFNGKPLTEGIRGADNVYFAEWLSLERGKHELEIVLTKKDGSEERLAVEFTY